MHNKNRPETDALHHPTRPSKVPRRYIMSSRISSRQIIFFAGLLLQLFADDAIALTLRIATVTTRARYNTRIRLSQDGRAESDELRDLRERASKLRQEAMEMESELRSNRPERDQSLGKQEQAPAPTNLKDSAWTFSYRFSDKPEPSDKESSADTDQRVFYSGRIKLKFRGDGYTDLVSHDPSGDEKRTVDIVKAWGWDLETSNEDEKDYLLFSLDVKVPGVDGPQRFYFQARQEKEPSGSIALKDGTVTIKQDITESSASPGFWGLFSPKGILAQFRYVGNFAAMKPKV